MTVSEFRDAIRLHLKDSGTVWSEGELNRCIAHSVADVSRFIPRKQIYDFTLDLAEISNESITMSGVTVQSLANKPVKYDSETVTNTGGTVTYTRDTDYTMDYWNGTIVRLTTGSITTAQEVYVDYARSQVAIDISGLTDLIRVQSVEYYSGQVPRKLVGYKIWGDWLIVQTASDSGSPGQGRMADEKHIVLFYDAQHTSPGAAAGSTPLFLDEILVKGAQAYAWLIEAAQYEHAAAADFASARTEFGFTIAVHSAVVTALNSARDAAAAATTTVGTISATKALAAFDSAEAAFAEASAAINRILTGDDYHALADAAFDSGNAEIDKIVADASTGDELYDAENVEDTEPGSEGDTWLDAASAPAAKKVLSDGYTALPNVNKGEEVSQRYADYAIVALQVHDRFRAMAQHHLSRAAARTQAGLAYINEGQGRIAQAQTVIAEAQSEAATGLGYARSGEGRVSNINAINREAEAEIGISAAYAREAEIRIAELTGYITEGSLYVELGVRNLELADRYRDMGLIMRNEFWSILGDRTQQGTPRSDVSSSQTPYK